MKDVKFVDDVFSKGAILGALMLVSHIIEQAIIIYKGTIGWLSFEGLEMVFVLVLYVTLMYKFAKRYSKMVYEKRTSPKYFTFGEGLAYVVLVSMLAGVIVSLGGYLFRHCIVGYDNYIAGYVEMLQNVLSSSEMPASMANMYDGMFSQLENKQEPSLPASIASGVFSYLESGLIIGLIIAICVKRAPVMFDKKDNDAE